MKHHTKAQRAHARRRYFAMQYDPAPWLAERAARGCRCSSPFVGACGRCDSAWHFGCPCHDVNLPGASPTVRASPSGIATHASGDTLYDCHNCGHIDHANAAENCPSRDGEDGSGNHPCEGECYGRVCPRCHRCDDFGPRNADEPVTKCICGPCRDRTCGGTGWLQCWCGGESCVCLVCGAGEIECLGCRECDVPDDEYYNGEMYDV